MPVYVNNGTVTVYQGEPATVTPGMLDMAVPLAWRDVTGKGVVVGVIDTGVDFNHKDLKGSVLEAKDFTGTRTDGWDDNGHGTHVCGIIKMVAPDVKIVSAKVLSATGFGSEEHVTQAIRWLADWHGPNGEKISAINMSLGGSQNYIPMEAALNYADSMGIVVSCAAGNEGNEDPTANRMGYPGRYRNALAVAAVGRANHPWYNRPAPFTSSGPDDPADGVDIASYGWEVTSCWPGDCYATLNGTSMATPHITGAIALLVELYRLKHREDPTAEGIYEGIVSRGQPVPMRNRTTDKMEASPAWNTIVGAGRFSFLPYAEFISVDAVIGDKKLVVNGYQTKEMDVAAFIKDGRAFIPVRFLAETYNSTVQFHPDPGNPSTGGVHIYGYRTSPIPLNLKGVGGASE